MHTCKPGIALLLLVFQLVLLELENLTPLGVVLYFWVEKLGLGKLLPVEVLPPGDETHFGLAEDEQEETALANLFGGCKMARKVSKLLRAVSK